MTEWWRKTAVEITAAIKNKQTSAEEVMTSHLGRVDAVNGKAEVFLDGGVRRGEDIVKARALGATAACGGRLWFWPLAVGGEAAVSRVIDILSDDVDRTLALLGRRRFDDVTSDALFSTAAPR